MLNADGQADMDTEYLLNRVYGGTSWYTIAVLEQAMEAYDTQAERHAQIVSNRREDVQPETMVRREAELVSSEMAHSLLPSSVKHSTQEYGKDLRCGASSASYSCSPPPWCGTGCGTPGLCNGPPAGDGPF